MRRRNWWFLIVCIAVLIAAVFLEPSYGWKLRGLLSPGSTLQADYPGLAAQNEVLSARLAKLQNLALQLPNAPPNYLRAMVYSRYPLNFKNEILVDAGANQGVAIGKAVVFQGILIGSVEKVFSDSSLVRTIFDGTFKVPVRVGSAGYDALLVGGAYPKATSMEKKAVLHAGDIVYTAASGFPYGLPIAVIRAAGISPDGLFAEAALGFAYDINSVQTVLIVR